VLISNVAIAGVAIFGVWRLDGGRGASGAAESLS